MTWIILECIGVALGLGGAVLVAGATASRRRLGFSLWIGSNAFLIAWAIHATAYGLLHVRDLLGDHRGGMAE